MDSKTYGQSPSPACSALVAAAKKCAELSRKFTAADARLKELMKARYGEHDEMPDTIVDVTQYGATGKTITLKWLDAEMTEAGFPPNASAQLHREKEPA